MKFEVIIDEECAARNAGFVFDESADREIDRDLYNRLCIERGEQWTDGKLDDLWDNCGSLYKGDDGAFYEVLKVYDSGSYKPLAWHRLVKSDNAVVSSYYLIKLWSTISAGSIIRRYLKIGWMKLISMAMAGLLLTKTEILSGSEELTIIQNRAGMCRS